MQPDQSSNRSLWVVGILAGTVVLLAVIVAGTVLASQGTAPVVAQRAAAVTTTTTAASKPPVRHRAKAKAKVITRTLIQAPPTTTTIVQQPAVGPQSTPAGATKACDPNISAAQNTSCPFAENVFVAYYDSYIVNGPTSAQVDAYSSDSNQTYSEGCAVSGDGLTINCSHGTDLVTFPLAAIQVYHP